MTMQRIKSKPTPLWRAVLLERRIPTRYLTNNAILNLFFGIRLKHRNGIEEAWMINENFNYDIYCPKGFEIRKNDTVIDIGANKGIFTLYAAAKASEGNVIAFEPMAGNFRHLKENVMLNRFNHAHTFNLGVSDKKKKIKLFLSDDCPQMHSIYNKNTSDRHVFINCVSLKDIFDDNRIDRCNFLKIDCEGAEYDILYGAPEECLERIDKISMECHDIGSKEKNGIYLGKYLTKKGFKIRMRQNQGSSDTGMIYAMRERRT